jgi:hypothetical protein
LDIKKRYREEQIIGFLREAESGIKVKDLCRRHGFSEASFYAWRSGFGGMDVSDAKRLQNTGRDALLEQLDKFALWAYPFGYVILIGGIALALMKTRVFGAHAARCEARTKASQRPLVSRIRAPADSEFRRYTVEIDGAVESKLSAVIPCRSWHGQSKAWRAR